MNSKKNMTTEEFNNLKEGDILYSYAFNLYKIEHIIEKIDYMHGKKYIIMNNDDDYYDEDDCLCFYISEKKCKIAYLKHLKKENQGFKNEIKIMKDIIDKHKKFIEENVEEFI